MVQFRKQNFWFNEPVLASGEDVLFEIPANHTQGRRAVGGKCFATKERFLFVPNRMDAVLGGSPLEIRTDTITDVSVSPPKYSVGELFSGAWRSRLAVTADSAQYLFVVNKLELTIQKLKQLRFG